MLMTGKLPLACSHNLEAAPIAGLVAGRFLEDLVTLFLMQVSKKYLFLMDDLHSFFLNQNSLWSHIFPFSARSESCCKMLELVGAK